MTDKAQRVDYEAIEKAVARAKAGDKGAKESLLLIYKPLLCKYAVRAACMDANDGEDCLQDMGLALLKAIDAYDAAKGNFTGFLTGWLRLTMLARRRSLSVAADVSLDAPASDSEDALPLIETIADERSDPAIQYHDHIERRRTRRRLKRWVGALTPKQKEVIYRHHLKGESLRAIARESKADIKTICKHHSSGIKKYSTTE